MAQSRQPLQTLPADGEPLFPRASANRCGPSLSDEALIQMYSRSRINLGFSNVADTTTGIKQVRLRDFEVPMSGGFYMVETMPELAEFFVYDREIVGYTGRKTWQIRQPTTWRIPTNANKSAEPGGNAPAKTTPGTNGFWTALHRCTWTNLA